jgi:hypothetical protein
MTNRTQQATPGHWVLGFRAALVAALTVILGMSTASASVADDAENRVGASAEPVTVLVGASAQITAGQQLGKNDSRSEIVVATGVAAKTVDNVLPGVKAGWPSRVADNGKGTVWQAPGSTGNANMLRVMEPTERYPSGYVRFYNEHGQPIGLNGKPGPRPDTHIPRGPDGTYDLPEGW